MKRFLLALLVLLPATAFAQAADSLADASAFDELSSLLEEEVETAATYAQRVRDVAASASVITADELERLGHRTVGQALAYVRGFTLTDDLNYEYVGVRGLGRPSDYNSRIAILIDGVPVRDGYLNSAPLGETLGLPISAIERIEVVRGPGSALYGTGAMFAVVNVITKDIRTLEGVQGTVSLAEQGAVRAEGVATAALPRGAAVSLAVYGTRRAGADVYFPEFDAPETGGGVARDLDWERAGGGVFTLQAGETRLSLFYSERDKGIPTASFETVFGARSWTRDRKATGALRSRRELSPRVSLFGLASVNHYYYYGVYPYDDGDGAYDSYDDSFSTAAEARVRLQWDPSPAHRIVLGTDAAYNFQSR